VCLDESGRVLALSPRILACCVNHIERDRRMIVAVSVDCIFNDAAYSSKLMVLRFKACSISNATRCHHMSAALTQQWIDAIDQLRMAGTATDKRSASQ
jgi:hypothetical protein